MRRIAIGTATTILLAAIMLAAWSFAPHSANKDSSDPAMVYLNASDRLDGALHEDYFEHEGKTLHYIEGGHGKTIVLLHGFPSYWYSFARQIETLSKDYRVIAIDGLGAGRSDAPTTIEAYELETMAEHILALLADLEIEEFHLVGHDWGAVFAFGIAQQNPDRVKSVTGIGAPPLSVLLDAMASSPRARERAGYIERFKSANPLLILATGAHKQVWRGAYDPLVQAEFMTREEGEFFRAATGNPRRLNAHINWYRANIPAPDDLSDRDHWPAKGARLTVPALLIWGSEDRVMDDAYIESLNQSADDLTKLEFSGVGHWPHFERADDVTHAIKELIERTESN